VLCLLCVCDVSRVRAVERLSRGHASRACYWLLFVGGGGGQRNAPLPCVYSSVVFHDVLLGWELTTAPHSTAIRISIRAAAICDMYCTMYNVRVC